MPRPVGQLIAFLAPECVTDASQVTRDHLEAFMVSLLESRSPATANNRFRALRQFFRWLTEDEYLSSDPMDKMTAPKVPEQPVETLSEEAVKALLATCRTKSVEDRRDEAIIRLLADSGVRRGELLAMWT
jgi:site-specific recombinase XerD